MLTYVRAIVSVVIYFCVVYRVSVDFTDIIEATYKFIKRRIFKRPSYLGLIVIKK